MNTVSIEVAKELFDLGWKRAGIFVYDNEEKIEHQQGFSYFKGEYALKELRDIKRMHDDIIPAPQLHEIIELLQFSPSTEQLYEIPLLIFPPWINKFYTMHLRPQNSLIRWLASQ